MGRNLNKENKKGVETSKIVDNNDNSFNADQLF